MQILYFGMWGAFSRIPLSRLLAAGADVCGVVVPGGDTAVFPAIIPLFPQKNISALPLFNPYPTHNIIHLAWEHDIPAYELHRLRAPETRAALAELQPDVALVACFSKRIPAALLTLPTHGFLNLHPSLLPDYRGPEPLFWQLRDGVNPVGVTLHVMDVGLDTGDVVGQTAVLLPDGVSRSQIDNLCAEAGADLMLTALDHLAAGALPRRPQPEGGSYQPSPQPADFQLDANWSAQRVFNFMRGTAEYGRPYPLHIAGQQLYLTEALAYEPDGDLDKVMVGDGREARIQFTPGVLRARVRP